MEQTKADHAQRLHSLSQHHLLQLQKLEQVASRGKQQLEAQTKLGGLLTSQKDFITDFHKDDLGLLDFIRPTSVLGEYYEDFFFRKVFK